MISQLNSFISTPEEVENVTNEDGIFSLLFLQYGAEKGSPGGSLLKTGRNCECLMRPQESDQITDQHSEHWSNIVFI